MKTLLLFIFSIISCEIIIAQKTTAIEQWAILKNSVKSVDSLANQVKKQRISIFKKRSKIILVALDNTTIKHKIKVNYKRGNIIAKHTYFEGGGKKIKLLFINSELVLAKMKYKNYMKDFSVKNTFTLFEKNKWYWVHKGKIGWKKSKTYKKVEYIY